MTDMRYDPVVVVGFSGGIDSQACALWCRQRFPAEKIVLLNADAGGNEHPLTTKFIERYSRVVFPVIQITAQIKDLEEVGTMPGATRDRRNEFAEDDRLTFDRLAYIKGIFPSRMKQFCTQYLKLLPQKRWLEENLVSKGIDYERFIGVRRDESIARRDALEKEWDTAFDTWVHRTLASWSKDDCFKFVSDAGEEINPLYLMGFSRVGCAPCVNASKDDIRLWAARFPEIVEKVREWEEYTGRSFFMPKTKGKINFIDEVVEWSRTSRGQPLLPIVETDSGCISKYGLCE